MGAELQGGWRWLVIGRFGTARGEPFFIGPGELPARLEAARVEIEIDVVDRLADDAARRVELLFPRLRSFSTEAVVRAVPLLSELSSLLAHASHSVILDGVERLVGRGRLYRALQAVADPTEAGTRAAPSKEKSLEDVLRAVTQAHADKEQHAARAIDVFIRATRARPEPAQVAERSVRKRPLHDVLREIVEATARDVLEHPEVRALEGAWRGLRMLSDQLPRDGSIQLAVVDAPTGQACELLELWTHRAPSERPDAVFVVEELQGLGDVTAYAKVAAALQSTCVLGVRPSALSVPSFDALRSEAESRALHALRQLRASDSMQWIALVGNEVLVEHEERPSSSGANGAAGSGERLVFASAVWAVAALLTRAQREHGRIARALAPELLLPASTFWIPSKGRDAGMALPTAEFCSVRAQMELAAEGLTVLGSTRRGDELLASAMPVACTQSVTLDRQIARGRELRVR